MIMEWGKGMIGPLIYLEQPFIWLNQKLTFGDTFGLTAVDAINSTDAPVLILHGNEDRKFLFCHPVLPFVISQHPGRRSGCSP